jgi:hypothetical protein
MVYNNKTIIFSWKKLKSDLTKSYSKHYKLFFSHKNHYPKKYNTQVSIETTPYFKIVTNTKNYKNSDRVF